MMWQDPIVEEIREIRRNIEGECDNNFDKLFAQAIEAPKEVDQQAYFQRRQDAVESNR